MKLMRFALAACLAAVLTAALPVKAAPVFVAEAEGGVRIVLTDEPCALKASVANLPFRATWTEKGTVFEGCFWTNPAIGVVMAYFTDKTVAAIPIPVFRKVHAL